MNPSSKSDWQLPVFCSVGFFLYLAAHENGHAAVCLLTGNRLLFWLPIYTTCSDSTNPKIAIAGTLTGIAVWALFTWIFLKKLMRLKHAEWWFSAWAGMSASATIDVLLEALLIHNPHADSERFIAATSIPPWTVVAASLIILAGMLTTIVLVGPTFWAAHNKE
jgi:hypothetical protein